MDWLIWKDEWINEWMDQLRQYFTIAPSLLKITCLIIFSPRSNVLRLIRLPRAEGMASRRLLLRASTPRLLEAEKRSSGREARRLWSSERELSEERGEKREEGRVESWFSDSIRICRFLNIKCKIKFHRKLFYFFYINPFVVNAVLLKLCLQTVSVQVQPVRYQSQPGLNPADYNPMNYQRNYQWARSR